MARHRMCSSFFCLNVCISIFFFLGGGGGGGVQKNEYFLGTKILWIFFWGSSQNWTIFRGHFYAF